MDNQIRPIVSIIIPIYNASEFLNDCLESVSKQIFTKFEVLCIDDGSTDDSKAICESYVKKDKRFHLYCQENSGVSAARNNGLGKANGDYISFIDSDDIVDPNYLNILMDISKNGNMGICSYTRLVTELGSGCNNLEVIPVRDYIISIIDENIPHPTIWMMIFKNNIIKKNSIIFTVGCIRNEDSEFFIKYMMYEKYVTVTDYKGYFYRNNPSSAVHKYDLKSLTIIEADQRISEVLVRNKVIGNNNLIVPASIQYMVFKTARYGNKNIYNKVHELYDVNAMMKKMLYHPRFSRKIVALIYIFFGNHLFYRIISLAARF